MIHAKKSSSPIRIGLLLVFVSLLALLSTSASLATASKPGITVQAAPASQSVERGKVASYVVTVSSSSGFAGTVTLAASKLPSGAVAAFAPASVTLTAGGAGATANSTMTVSTTSATPTGTHAFSVVASGDKVSGTVDVGLTVNTPVSGSLSMSAAPSSATIQPGEVAVYTVSLTRTGVSGNVTFGLSGPLPAGASWAYTPNPTTSSSTSLQVSVPATADDGTFQLTLTASGADAGGVTRSAVASVTLVVSTKGKDLVLAGDATGVLAPGVWLPIDVAITNPNKKQISVVGLAVTVSSVQRTALAVGQGLPCGPADYAVSQYAGPYPVTVPGTSTRSLSQLGISAAQWPRVSMVNRPVNQDGCKGARVLLAYSGSGQGK